MGDIGCAAALLFVLGISARSGPAGAVLVLLALPAFTRLLRSLAPEEHPGPWPDTAVVIACMTVPMWAVLILVFGSAGR